MAPRTHRSGRVPLTSSRSADGGPAKIPQSWPSSARYTRGGNIQGTVTFAGLEALRTFNETVDAKSGQDSGGSTDLVFTVYQPSITITPPPNAKFLAPLPEGI
jgi:hypothetical protein